MLETKGAPFSPLILGGPLTLLLLTKTADLLLGYPKLA